MARTRRKPKPNPGAPLTERQATLFEYISDYWAQFGIGPTVREIAAEFEMNLSAVMGFIYALESKGVLLRTPGESRTLRPAKRTVCCDCPHCGKELSVVEEFEKG